MTRAVVAGAGGIGTRIAAGLLRGGAEVRVLARWERAERWRREGLWLNGERLALRKGDIREAAEPGWAAELVFLAVKGPDLAGAMDDLEAGGWVGEGTGVVSLLNGIEASERVKARFGEGRGVAGLVLCNSAVREGTQVRQEGLFQVVLEDNEGGRRAVAALRAGGIEAETRGDIRSAQWEKLALNAGLNQAEALLGLNHGQLLGNPDARAFMESLTEEAIAVAAAEGVGTEEERAAWRGRIREALGRLSPEGKTSMLQDVEAGRATEVDFFAGTICRLGRKHGVAVPCNELVWAAFRG